MSAKSEEFSTHCDWCKIEVISFVAPPAMIDVTTNAWERRTDRVCLDCYAELLGLMARRAEARQPA